MKGSNYIRSKDEADEYFAGLQQNSPASPNVATFPS